MSEYASASEEPAHLSPRGIDFILRYTQTLRTLFHAKLFEVMNDPNGPKGRKWANVLDHSITVGRALDTLGELLGFSQEERDHLAQVGLIHDWNKRLVFDEQSFTPEEKLRAEVYARETLAEHDPKGYLIAATEPLGLPRLESDAATLAEHCVHFIDLSCLPQGLVTTEERFAEFVRRGKTADEDGQVNMWERKKALVAKEEAMFLDIIRKRGRDVPPGARLRDVLAEAMDEA